MEITSLLVFLLSTVGLTQIVVYSDFFLIEWFRAAMKYVLPARLYQVFECSMCFGFWAGLFCSHHLLAASGWHLFLCGCAGSFASTLANNALEYLVSNSVVTLPEDTDA